MSHWEEKYRAKAIPWDRGATSPALLGWLDDGTLTAGRALIPGCGRGHEAVELARRGFQVTALDIAPSALEHLASELAAAGVEAERVCADALSWQPPQPFDAIYEQTCLCALDPGHWPAYEQQLFAWLRPGGKLFALFMQTESAGGPPFHCALPNMHALFAAERWQWPQDAPGRVAHPNGLFEYAAVLTRRG
jgi:SAM-dependent methyltransferase